MKRTLILSLLAITVLLISAVTKKDSATLVKNTKEYTENEKHPKTQVLVVGTIHGSHERNPNYTNQDIVNILGTYNPDVICVEIPSSYFRKRSYLKEMMIASIYGFENNKKVYPIDWWSAGDRKEQEKFRESEEYKTKEKIIEDLVKADTIMQNFKQKYGDWGNVWKENNKGYAFYNGKECNNFVKQMYKISMSVYGDSFMNLHYESRNSKMLELINSAIMANKGKRIIVLTGTEHKHYFDIELSKRKNIKVIDFESILPLNKIQISSNINNFIERNLAKGYYDTADSSAIDIMYHGALIPLIHGLGMDDNPAIIPAENIKKANLILREWKQENSKSVYLQFEKAWIQFLEKNYQKAIASSQSISEKLNEIPKNIQWFVKPFYYRNLGFCYDLTEQREKAILAYKKCKEICKELKLNENFAKSIYKEYDLIPYEIKDN